MQGGIKLVLVVAGCVIAMAVFVGVSESNRRAKLEKEREALEAQDNPKPGSMVDVGNPNLAGSEAKLTIGAGNTATLQGSYNGPLSLRVSVNAPYKVSFGLVPKAQREKYYQSKNVEAAMEKIPCGSGGTGAMAISCDLTAENKDMVLVIADLRDSTQVMRSINELVKNRKSPAKPEEYFNIVNVSVAVTKIAATSN